MNLSDKTLVKKLIIVLAIKLVALMGLWWLFVREQHVPVDSNSVSTQFLAPALTQAKGTQP
ncbi:cytochrome oxidase putative small subunit CydP [Rhodoferax sp.]|uniref:cytochrome oxidase putative small subunit CydP n=1 Tax=Rhodoferax sp. TaxID=50421 RepID=UPI002ACDDE82|nr:cytochrome oxidase putative small subunit CydP [Rhodoferax sp.]MDZ7920188.1 hypothetical protein [Rhodoferax sp.]